MPKGKSNTSVLLFPLAIYFSFKDAINSEKQDWMKVYQLVDGEASIGYVN